MIRRLALVKEIVEMHGCEKVRVFFHLNFIRSETAWAAFASLTVNDGKDRLTRNWFGLTRPPKPIKTYSYSMQGECSEENKNSIDVFKDYTSPFFWRELTIKLSQGVMDQAAPYWIKDFNRRKAGDQAAAKAVFVGRLYLLFPLESYETEKWEVLFQ